MKTKKHILVFGAGAIGRGYLPWVFSPKKFEYDYVEKNATICRLINHEGGFVTRKVTTVNGKGTYRRLSVPVNRCFLPGEESKTIDHYDVVMVAVGPRNALSLAPSLKGTKKPIICFENDPTIHKSLQNMTGNNMIVFGIPDVIASNTAPAKMLVGDPLSIVTEDGFCYVDKLISAVGGKVRYVTKGELDKQWLAKFYLHNTPHCIAAYLGALAGASYIHEVMDIVKARKIVTGAMKEMQRMLLRRYKLKKEFVTWYADKELGRFESKLLYDPVSRVAREPFRKLAPNERLLGAAQLCLSEGVYPRYIMLGIMAAFFYNNTDDPDINIHYLVESLNSADFLRIVMQLSPEEALYQLLHQRWNYNKFFLKNL